MTPVWSQSVCSTDSPGTCQALHVPGPLPVLHCICSAPDPPTPTPRAPALDPQRDDDGSVFPIPFYIILSYESFFPSSQNRVVTRVYKRRGRVSMCHVCNCACVCARALVGSLCLIFIPSLPPSLPPSLSPSHSLSLCVSLFLFPSLPPSLSLTPSLALWPGRAVTRVHTRGGGVSPRH